MRPARVTITSAFLLTLALPAAAAEEADEGNGRLKIDFDARETVYVPGPPPRVVLSGEVRIECAGVRVEAAGVVLTPETGELYAEGTERFPVRFADEERVAELVCESLVYDFRTHHGRAERARLTLQLERPEGAARPGSPRSKGRIERGEVSTVAVESEVITREGRDRFVAEEASVTSCEFARPHWRLKARSVEVEPGAFLRARGVRLYMGRVPVFYWPVYTYRLAHTEGVSREARPVGVDVRFGTSGRWGCEKSLRLRFPVARDLTSACGIDMWGFSTGHRSERGWEAGAVLEWKGARAEGHARTDFFFEDSTSTEHDMKRAETNALRRAPKIEGNPFPMTASRYLAALRGEPTPNTETHLSYMDEPRYFAEIAHRSDLGSGWEAEARVFFASDRDVRQEYLERDAKTGLPGFSYVDFRRRTPGSLLSIYSGFRTGAFRTETEYLPEIRWTMPAADLGGGVLLAAEARSGFLKRSYDELIAGEGYDAFRARTRLVLSRPFRLGPVAFSPWVGTDQAFYDRSLLDRDPFVQGAGLYGGAISTRLFGNLRTGDRPLRHVIEARAEYIGVTRTTRDDPVEVPGFDRTDDLMQTDRLRFSIDQRWQTKRRDRKGVSRTHELAGLLLSAELFAKSEGSDILNDGRDWAPFTAAVFASPSPRFRLYSALEWEKHTGTTLTWHSGVEFSGATGPPERPDTGSWRAGLFFVESQAPKGDPGVSDSRELALRLGVAPAGRWAVEFTGRYEFEEFGEGPGWTDTRLRLVRDFHDWELRFSVWHDPAEGDSGVSMSVMPKGYPVNLPAAARARD